MSERLQLIWIRIQRRVAMNWQKMLIKAKTALPLGKLSKRYFCPCCGKYCAGFIDWSNSYKNVVCPYCECQPRHRALSLYLNEQTNWNREKLKVLHFAPEPSLRKQFSSMPNIDYTTADFYDSSVDVKIDVTQIPYPNNTFDVIFCNHVLEHIMDDRKAMRELFRILKLGGWASLQVPISRKREKTFEDPTIVSSEDRLRYFHQEDHVRLYGLDYKNRLEEAGFIVKIETPIKELNPEQSKKYGLSAKDDLYFGIKHSFSAAY